MQHEPKGEWGNKRSNFPPMKPEDEAAKDVLNRPEDTLPKATGTRATTATDGMVATPPSTVDDSGGVFSSYLEADFR